MKTQTQFNLAVLRALKDQYNAIATLQASVEASEASKADMMANMEAMTASLDEAFSAMEELVREQRG